MLIRARTLLPITAPPIEDGAVRVSGVRITDVGRWPDLRARHGAEAVVDLGEVALLPGLINAHCHLDYTHFAGHLAPPRSFTEWIQGIIALKAGWSFSEFAASWVAGAKDLLHSGCTTVVDFEAVPELLPETWPATPLRVSSALEITGVRAQRTPAEILAETTERFTALEAIRPARHRLALAPHAPYSTVPELLRQVARTAPSRGGFTTIHVAESAEEDAMFRRAEGAMYQWLRPQRVMDDCDGRSPVKVVADAGLLGPTCLFAHVNHADAADVALLAASGTPVVHCPRSHDYFGHTPFPYAALREAGVTVCLGTDSLLTVRKLGRQSLHLDLWEELRAFAALHPARRPMELLSLITAAAARAIGRADELGSLTAGTLADLIAVPCPVAFEKVEEAVLQHRGPVSASMIDGAWALAPAGLALEPTEPAT